MTKLGRVLLVVSLTLIFAFTAFARSADHLAEVPPAFAPNEVLVQNDLDEVLVSKHPEEVLVRNESLKHPEEVLVLNKGGEKLVPLCHPDKKCDERAQPSEVLVLNESLNKHPEEVLVLNESLNKHPEEVLVLNESLDKHPEEVLV